MVFDGEYLAQIRHSARLLNISANLNLGKAFLSTKFTKSTKSTKRNQGEK